MEVKTTKAFANAKNKTAEDREEWSKSFATEQQAYAAESLSPISQALQALGGSALDIEGITAKYGQQIAVKASGDEPLWLIDIVKGEIQK